MKNTYVCTHVSTDAFTTASTATTIKCAQCGVSKHSGKVSCCAKGGAWFQKCGDPGDSNFDHTWSEGIRACKIDTTYHPPTNSRIICPTCATNKQGQLTCCAKGGSWHQNCGDSKDYTWNEGFAVCERKISPFIEWI